MKTNLVFRAPYVNEYTGEEMEFVYKYKVPKGSFDRIREVLTNQLKAEYNISGHTFTFLSRDDLYLGLEKVASLMVTCK